MDTAREIVKKLSPSPRIAAPRARTRTAELQRASCRLQTNGVWWNRTTSKTGRRRQPSSSLHRERKSRQRNKLHTKAATTKTKRGLALYVASLFQIANREKNGSSVKCARNGSTSSAHQATRAVHTRLHEQCTPGYNRFICPNCESESHIMSCSVSQKILQ